MAGHGFRSQTRDFPRAPSCARRVLAALAAPDSGLSPLTPPGTPARRTLGPRRPPPPAAAASSDLLSNDTLHSPLPRGLGASPFGNRQEPKNPQVRQVGQEEAQRTHSPARSRALERALVAQRATVRARQPSLL